ncbi:hypothetical protein [Streptomyces mirabilis]|uniref:hypothetical protein n=1 Tax=Streptomyces mirabilis TaxID=68239 RepID=UPI00369CEE27
MIATSCRSAAAQVEVELMPLVAASTVAVSFADCESITPAVGSASRPSVSRVARSRSGNSLVSSCFRQR